MGSCVLQARGLRVHRGTAVFLSDWSTFRVYRFEGHITYRENHNARNVSLPSLVLDVAVDQAAGITRAKAEAVESPAVVLVAHALEHTMSIWSTLRGELREIAWLASIIGGLSALGVGLAVTLALALNSWASWVPTAAWHM